MNLYRYRFPFLVSVSLLLLTTACRQDEPVVEVTTALNLNYRATYGNDPLVMGKWFAYLPDVKVQFTAFDFYVSDLTLLRDVSPNGDGSAIKEIALLDFSKLATAPAAMTGLSNLIDHVPVGTYQGVRLGIGVPSDLNRTRPIEYAPDHPLRRDDRYQSDWESYIFTVIAGNYDTDDDGVADGTFSYEVGTDEFYRKMAVIKGIEVVATDTPDLKFKVDVSRLLRVGNEPFDVVGQPTDESLKLAERIAENFTTAFTLE